MQRKALLTLLEQFQSSSPEKLVCQQQFIAFVSENEDCFLRSNLAGHVTGSAWIIDKSQTHCLLMHHRKLNCWLQLGGHADGDSDLLRVATKEALEESGLQKVSPLSEQILDIDIHTIPARHDISEHLHYDARFLFEADMEQPLVSNSESNELAWVPIDRIKEWTTEPSVLQMALKSTSVSVV